MELTEETAEKIRSLKFNSEAEIINCQIPLGSITWSDEFPEDNFFSFWSGPDRDEILRLFVVRMNYWETGTTCEEDKSYWEDAQKQFPNWPIFQRMELSDEERKAHQEVQNELEEFVVGLVSGADEFETTTKDGIMAFSATFNLEKAKKRKWWEFWR